MYLNTVTASFTYVKLYICGFIRQAQLVITSESPYHIDPLPSVSSSVYALSTGKNNDSTCCNSQCACPDDAPGDFICTAYCMLFESPQLRPELRDCNCTENDSVDPETEIIESNCWLWTSGMPCGVLFSDDRRVQEYSSSDSLHLVSRFSERYMSSIHSK